MTLCSPLDILAQKLTPVARRLAALALLLGAGWIDYATGLEVAGAPFYVPILLGLALFDSWRLCLIYAGIAAAIYLGADLLNEPDALTLIYPYWRAFARLISFALISVTTSVLVEERRRLHRSEQALAERAEELAAKNRALNDTLQEVQRLHLELTAKNRQAVRVDVVNAATRDMERPLTSVAIYVEEVKRLVRQLTPTEDTVLVLDQLYPLLEKLQERLQEMEKILETIRSSTRESAQEPRGHLANPQL